jgi:hypothetical protein
MLRNNESPAISTSPHKCVPDYEEMIKRIKEKINVSSAFRDAAIAYFDGCRAHDKWAELIGELVTECYCLQKELDSLIQSQENA